MYRRSLLAALGTASAGCLRLSNTDGTSQQDPSDTATATGSLDPPPETATATVTDSGTDESSTETVTEEWLTELWTGPAYVRNLFTADGTAFLAEGSPEGSKLAGYDPGSGERTFESAPIGQAYSTFLFPGSWAVTDETVFFGAGAADRNEDSPVAARLYAFDRSDGSIRFTYDAPADGAHTNIKYVDVASSGPVVVASDSDGSGENQQPLVVALDRDTGAVQWQVTGGESFANGLAVTPETVYANTDQFRLYDPVSGDRKREVNLSSFYGFTLADGIVYTTGETITAYDVENRRRVWEATPPAGTVKSHVTVADGRVYAATDAGWLVGIDSASGEQVWSTRLRASVRSYTTPPAVGQRFVWVSDESGRVYLVRPSSGEQSLTIAPPADNDFARPIRTVDGVAVVGGVDSVAYRVTPS
jgi:outer membrane protein assembly factor BamB